MKQIRRSIVSVSLLPDPFEGLLSSKTNSHSRRKKRQRRVALVFDTGFTMEWYVQISFQQSLFANCILSSIASCDLPCPFVAHTTMLILLEMEICDVKSQSQLKDHAFLRAQVLVHQRLASLGTKSHFPIPQLLFQFTFELDKIQKLSAHAKRHP